MEKVTIALGSNLGNRLQTLRKAGEFLSVLSEKPVKKASIWESEPVGGAKYRFYNTVAQISTTLPAAVLLGQLKQFEQQCGREQNPVRWGPRILDLDIIHYGSLAVQNESLIIPHPEYQNRLFVLMPLFEIDNAWHDPVTHTLISDLIEQAPEIEIKKTELTW